MPTPSLRTTINSTALDFDNIKNNLKTYLANQTEFSDYNFEASGLSNILDVLAYNTHINGLIANFALNESYLNTAQLRSSAVSLAEGIGFIPNTDTSAQALVRISFTTDTTPRDSIISLPAFTEFTTVVDEVTYTFQNTESFFATDNGSGFYEFLTADGSNLIPLREGTRKTKTFLAGEYEENPVYVIPDTKLDSATAVVNVFPNSTSTDATAFQNINNISTVSASTTAYILKESPNGNFELSFGDGVTFGNAPSAGSRIEITYLATNGAAANSASTFTPSSSLSGGGVVTPLTVITSSNASGGQAKQTIESIRKNAPFQYVSQNRMVTAEDYTALIKKNFSTFIKDISSWGGEDNDEPEFGAVYVSILFNDNVEKSTKDSIKRQIVDLGNQLAIVSFKVRFVDPVQTFIELDTTFQFNPDLTDKNLNAITNSVTNVTSNYFGEFGLFNKSFRRSNLLTLVDESSAAVLSSRADVRVQRRFTPTAPSLIAVINELTLNSLEASQINEVVGLVSKQKFDSAASFLVNGQYTASNFTVVKNKLAATATNINQTIEYPTSIASPDDVNFIITSTEFTLDGRLSFLRNKLSSNIIQVIAVNGDVVIDNVGSYDAGTGTVNIEFFNPSSIAGGRTDIKLSVVPSNPSAVSPIRNDILLFDPDRSSTTALVVSAEN